MLKQIKSFFGMQKKSIPNSPFLSFANYLALNGWLNLTAYMSILYYMQVSPLRDAVDKISKECSNIRLFVQDISTGKLENKHQVLDLFRHPNTDMGSHEFMEQLVSYFNITGNCFVVATGPTEQPPLELFVISPQYVTLIPDERDGYTKTVLYTSNSKSIAFERKDVKGRFRFYSPDGRQEIYHIRMFNPFRGVTNNYGMSPLTSIFYEMEQYIKASVHNLSLLARGARPSGIFSSKDTLGDDAFARLSEQIDRFNAGVENAGRIMLVDSGLTFQEMGINTKDMDYVKLISTLSIKIYNTYNIPLPLISQETMTYNNLEASRLMLYDNAVLPTFSRILEELSNFLMYRYDEEDQKELVYNKDSISALQIRRNEELRIVKEIGVNTVNEIRAMKGDEPAVGGDDIYSSGNAYPIARIGGKIEEEERENIEDDESKANQLDYINMMRRVRGKDGYKIFDDEELKSIWARYGKNS